MMVATDARGDYAFLSLKAPAFDLTDRGVSGRQVPAGLDAFVYTERGVYRSGETVELTALLRDGAGRCRAWRAADAGGRASGRRRIPPHRRGRPGRRRACARGAARRVVADRHVARARLHRSEASAGRRDDLHGRGLCARIGSNSTWRPPRRPSPRPRRPKSRSTAAISTARRLPASTSKARCRSRPPTNVPALPAISSASADEEVESHAPAARRPPQHRQQRQGEVQPSRSTRCPNRPRPLEAQVTVRMAEPGGRAVERKLTLPVTPDGPMIGVKPLFSGRSLGEGENATFDVVVAAPDGTPLARTGTALRAAEDRDALSVLSARRHLELRAGQDHAARRRRHVRRRRRQRRRAFRCRCSSAAIGSKSRPAIATGR